MNKTMLRYIIVENKIREAIRHRQTGDKLPGERVLAKEFDVSYMTVRKAVENHVTERILYKIPTRGTYVQKPGRVKGMIRNIGSLFGNNIN